MNAKLIKIEIKWFLYLRVWQFVKKWTWCCFFHKERCYPRVDIPDGQPGSDDWHCAACFPCGVGFDYLVEKSEAEKDND